MLMDIRMPMVDGLVATRRIAEDERLADVKVVILTTFDLDEYVFEAIRAGANGFLVKDTEPAELLAAVRAVVAGGGGPAAPPPPPPLQGVARPPRGPPAGAGRPGLPPRGGGGG